jgi:hypothetical protein
MTTGGRSLACGIILIASTADTAVAEDWRIYEYRAQNFSIEFPTPPEVRSTLYTAPLGEGKTARAPALTYAARLGRTQYKVQVVDYRKLGVSVAQALDLAASAYAAKATVGLDTRVSIANGECGRYLGVAHADGALSYVALFPDRARNRLFHIEARVPLGEQAERGAGGVHFQQSLAFLPSDKQPAPAPFPEAWKEYAYDEGKLKFRFPAPPQIVPEIYVTNSGLVVPATRYSAAAGGVLLKATVAELYGTPADLPDTNMAVDDAVAVLTTGAEIRASETVGMRNAQCGRALSLKRRNGVESEVSVFVPTSYRKLYIIEIEGGDVRARTEAAALFRRGFTLAKAGEE